MSNPFGGNSVAKGKKAGADPFDSAGPDGSLVPGRKGDPFSSPPVGGGGSSDVRISDFVGSPMLVKPTEYIPSIVTSASVEPTDAVRVDLVVLSEDGGEAELHEDMLIFNVALKRVLRRSMDDGLGMVLARLTLGEKKAGKNAPYLFVPAEEAAAIARAYCAAHPAW